MKIMLNLDAVGVFAYEQFPKINVRLNARQMDRNEI